MILTQLAVSQAAPSPLQSADTATAGLVTAIGNVSSIGPLAALENVSPIGVLTVIENATPIGVLTTINTGFMGPPGATAEVSISSDPDNRLRTGSDDGLYVPELKSDPLAYYILAKA